MGLWRGSGAGGVCPPPHPVPPPARCHQAEEQRGFLHRQRGPAPHLHRRAPRPRRQQVEAQQQLGGGGEARGGGGCPWGCRGSPAAPPPLTLCPSPPPRLPASASSSSSTRTSSPSSRQRRPNWPSSDWGGGTSAASPPPTAPSLALGDPLSCLPGGAELPPAPTPRAGNCHLQIKRFPWGRVRVLGACSPSGGGTAPPAPAEIALLLEKEKEVGGNSWVQSSHCRGVPGHAPPLGAGGYL